MRSKARADKLAEAILRTIALRPAGPDVKAVKRASAANTIYTHKRRADLMALLFLFNII
jgi:hypothetical protein